MPPMDYTPFNPAPYAASVGELLAHQNDAQARAAIAIGQAQARAQEISGQVWGNAVQSAAQIPAQLAHAATVQKETDSLAALRQSEIDKNQQDLQARQRGVVGQQLLGKLTQQYSTVDPITGISDINHDAIAADLSKAGFPKEAQDYLHGASAAAEDVEKIKTARRSAANATAESVGRIASTSDTADQYATGLDHLVAAGAITAAERAQFAQQVQQAGPDGWAALKKHTVDWADSIVKPIDVKEGDTLVNAISGTTRLSGAPKAKTTAELAADAANPASPTQAQSAAAMKLLKPTPNATTEQDDQRYRNIQAQLTLKQPVSPEDAAWAGGYEKQHTLGVDRTAGAAADRQAAAITQQNALQKKAQDFNVAQVARKDLTTVEKTYTDAQAGTNMLRDVVDAAKGGNRIAASMQNLQTAMASVKAAGFNRINMAEIGIPGTAGSFMDSLESRFGKLTAGQPVPADLQADMQKFADLLEKTAYKKYSDGFDSVAKFYSLTPDQKTLKMPAPGASSSAAPALTPGLSGLAGRK